MYVTVGGQLVRVAAPASQKKLGKRRVIGNAEDVIAVSGTATGEPGVASVDAAHVEAARCVHFLMRIRATSCASAHATWGYMGMICIRVRLHFRSAREPSTRAVLSAMPSS